MRLLVSLAVGASLALLPTAAQAASATLSGRICDAQGAVIVGATVELRSERDTERFVKTRTDALGFYRFGNLQKGDYTIAVTANGFRRVKIRSTHISNGERKSAPTLVLEVAPIPFFDPLDSIRFLRGDSGVGNLGGVVALYVSQQAPAGAPLAGADVALVCPGERVCGKTRTDSGGRFLFKRLAAGQYGIRVSRNGFYPASERGYEVRGGTELMYNPLLLERCHLGNCDPNLRPKKPLIVIE